MAGWLVAWLTWLDGVRAAGAPGSSTKGRDQSIEACAMALLLMVLGTVFTLAPGLEELAHADY